MKNIYFSFARRIRKFLFSRVLTKKKLGIFIPLLGIILTTFFSILNRCDPKNSVLDNSKSEQTENQETNITIDNSTKSETVNNVNIELKEANRQKVRLVNFTSDTLIEYINSSLVYELSNQADIVITLKSSGRYIKKGDESVKDIYSLTKGHVILTITNCPTKHYTKNMLPSFSLAPKSMIQAELQNEISSFVRNNESQLLHDIRQCLE